MVLVKSKIKKLVQEHKKRMSKEAWEALDSRVVAIVTGAIKLTGSFKTIKDTEIYMSGRGSK